MAHPPDPVPVAATVVHKRWVFVWNKKADGLRAFGFDFGPFALVVLRDAK